ncbi:nuclear transport factor 2 family protein [Acidicapsa acidisoli]|uniref:nuclear transport factor 2 family protein n=1 Tax=Acidicapsa acidisoli TaxID=1615681 RepID=UPI0021E0E3DD|nr:nuclear transport factor 2 family protein [Acidicapsa acidisoli]
MKSAIFAAFAVLSLSSSAAFSQTPAAAGSATSATSAESPEIRELQKIEDSWDNALNQRDQYGLELVLSPLFVNVSANGDITTRNQQVVSLINQEDKTATTDARVITVRMLGDVAVANGTYTYTHKLNGNMVEEKGVFTHVFQRQHGNWVCLNAQRTLLREEAPGKKASKAKTKSDAELPFHIPLFSKSDKSNSSNQ